MLRGRRFWHFNLLFFLMFSDEILAATDFTLVNEQALVRNGVTSFLKCVTEDLDLTHDAFKRFADTGSGARIPSYSLTGPISPQSWPGKKLSMLPDSGKERHGIFSCEATDSRNILTKAIAIKIGSGGGIWPKRFTYVASVGDEELHLTFEAFDPTVDVVWRFQGFVIATTTLQHTIDRVKTQHSGIYECYKPKEGETDENYRPLDKAMLRLIVRECPSGKWNYPSCDSDCACVNGGACDEFSGSCVCPPGFKGLYCEEGCGGNRFGSECQHKCKDGSSSSVEEECRGRQFCLPDPYGCSCSAGFSGLECDNGCPLDRFGADCLQVCHCKRPDLCNRFTGSCTLGCKRGWGGPSCQTPCASGTWGENCEEECHCRNGASCDPVNGRCRGGCASPYTGETCQVDGINECASNPCSSGATCTDEINAYRCECVEGTAGVNCEHDEDDCAYDPCLNGGSCRDEGISMFTCSCPVGFTGETCENEVNECLHHQCKNGADCVDLVAAYRCECPDGFIGHYCQESCPPGTHQRGEQCVLCGKGTYQSTAGRSSCLPCPPDHTTTNEGATDLSYCTSPQSAPAVPWLAVVIIIVVILLLTIVVALLWYFCSFKKKTRLQHLGPGRSAW